MLSPSKSDPARRSIGFIGLIDAARQYYAVIFHCIEEANFGSGVYYGKLRVSSALRSMGGLGFRSYSRESDWSMLGL